MAFNGPSRGNQGGAHTKVGHEDELHDELAHLHVLRSRPCGDEVVLGAEESGERGGEVVALEHLHAGYMALVGGRQRSSVVVSGDQRPPAALVILLWRRSARNQRSSEVIRGHKRS